MPMHFWRSSHRLVNKLAAMSITVTKLSAIYKESRSIQTQAQEPFHGVSTHGYHIVAPRDFPSRLTTLSESTCSGSCH